MAAQLPICARCGFTVHKRHDTDEGILCSPCYQSYYEENGEYPTDDGWCH